MRVDKNVFFRELTMRICGSLHLEAAMSEALAYLSRFMAADEMYMGLFDYEREVYRVIAKAGRSGSVMMNREYRLSREASATVRAFDKSRVHIVRRVHDDPLISALFTAQEFDRRSCLVVPLTADGQLVGVAQIYTAGEGKYGAEEAELLGCTARPFSIALANALEHLELLRLKQKSDEENRELRRKIESGSRAEVIGRDGGLKEACEMARLVAPLNSPVLILGETGTGKEVVANAIHEASARAKGPFVKVNCGAIPESLIDSELFGHEKGSFTGAEARRIGRFERAHLGTIFLDEIGELPPEAQVRLLRVIQEREIERVGGSGAVPVDIRIICATHRDLGAMMSEGAFREDLFFRINVFPIVIPPLRQRKQDIPLLAEYFLERKSRELGLRRVPGIGGGELEALMEYDWPGNVRELQNIIERALILSKEDKLAFAALLPGRAPRAGEAEERGPAPLDDSVRETIVAALKETRGRVSGEKGAAKILGINASTLRNKMLKLGIGKIGKESGAEVKK